MFSSHSRKRPYRVAIEGFSDFERSTLTSIFRLAERRVPAYAQVATPDSSDFLVADSEEPRVLAWIARERRVADTVFIGEQAPGDALAWLTRPIDPVHVLRALDALLGRRHAAEQMRPAAPETAVLAEAVNQPESGWKPAPPPGGGGDRPVLVADASPIARSFLARRLAGLGYRVSVAGSSEEALESAAWTAFAIVFVDLNLGAGAGLDGPQLCQTIKQQRRNDAPPDTPAVVITSGGAGATERVRATLAGCDAYLTKPLLQADVIAALRQVDSRFSATGVE